MNLRNVIDKYLAAAGAYGKSVPIESLGLSHDETEQIFDVLDEDYHISRFFHFTEADGAKFSIDGVPATHVSIDPEIRSIL
jgi:hypothetical protein